MPYHYNKTGVRILTMCPGLTQTEMIEKAPERMLDIIGPRESEAVINQLPIQKFV